MLMNTSLTTFDPQTNAGKRRVWLWASLAFAFLWSIPNLTFPIGRDQALYCVIAEGVLNGQRPYLDLWDNRPPTTFLAFLPIVKVFGHVMWSVGVVDILWVLAMSYFIFRFAERYAGAAAASLAVGVNAVWHSVAGYTHALVPSTFVIFFVLAGLFLVWKESPRLLLRHFAAGIMLGVAFWATYNAVMFLPLLLGLPYFEFRGLDERPPAFRFSISWREWLRRAVLLAAGFATAVLGMIVCLWFAGSWAEFYEINFRVMPGYARLPLERTEEYWLWAIVQTKFVLGQMTLAVLLVALIAARHFRELRVVAPIMLAAALGFLSAAAQVRFHAYYFETAYPFLAMIWGYMGVRAFESFRTLARDCRERGWRLARPLVWVLFANVVAWFAVDFFWATLPRFQALGLWWRDQEKSYASYPWPHTLEHLKGELGVIRYLKENSSPSDRIFIWGTQPVIYFLSERRPANRFISNLGLISPWGPRAWREELVRDLKKSPPPYLIVVRKDAIPSVSYTHDDSETFLKVFPDLAAFIRENYGPSKAIENFDVYRRSRVESDSL